MNEENKLKNTGSGGAGANVGHSSGSGAGGFSEPAPEVPSVAEQIANLTALVTAMSENDKRKDEEIKMLIELADEGRKEKFNSKKRPKIVSRVKLTTLNGKIVVGSKTLIDEVYKDLSDKGNWVEKQIHSYTLEDGTKLDLPLPQYTRIREFIEADVQKVSVVPEKEGKEGETFYRYTLALDDGRVLEVDAPYIN